MTRTRRPSASLHMAGLGLVGTAVGLAVSLAVDIGAGGDAVGALAASTLVVAVVGVVAWRATVPPDHLTPAGTFAAVSWTWIAVAVAAALPYVLSGVLPALDDALFESVSGLTTTGATVLSPIEGTSRGILFWRQLTQWYGGMGMIVLAVAVLPFLGVGGLSLIDAESPGPSADRLAPRVRETARTLWAIYAAITVAVALGLLAAGTSLYDAVAHALTTVSTGGFSPYDSSVAAFDSLAVEVVLIVGMLAGSISFVLHWQVLRQGPGAYWRSSELRTYVALMVVAMLFIGFHLDAQGASAAETVRWSVFNVVTVVTTAGFGTEDFVLWDQSAQAMLFVLMVTGAMSGSTAGGMKTLRLQLMARITARELRRVQHPRAVLPVDHDGRRVPEPILARVAGFVLLYVTTLAVGTIVVAALGADVVTAGSAVASGLGSIGPALGEAGPTSNYLVLSRPARGVVTFLMLLGRLELFPLLLLVHHPVRRLRELSVPR